MLHIRRIGTHRLICANASVRPFPLGPSEAKTPLTHSPTCHRNLVTAPQVPNAYLFAQGEYARTLRVPVFGACAVLTRPAGPSRACCGCLAGCRLRIQLQVPSFARVDLTRIVCAVTREARLGLRSATAQFDRPLKDAVPRLEVPFSRPFGAPAVLHPSSKLRWDSGRYMPPPLTV